MTFTLKTCLVGFALRLANTLERSAFELMFTIAESYDASDAFLYHNPQHHCVPICRHRLCPVPLPVNITQRVPRPPLTNVHQHQHFSSTPRTTHLLPEGEDRRIRPLILPGMRHASEIMDNL
ncbi:MAG: hypothetical protein ACLQIK_15940 [Mycobacterium sp.]|uniref:hypothetical protein n=1 Tax=Mycobacterium sp. TaxID=1785 RepID=UPI003F991F0A